MAIKVNILRFEDQTPELDATALYVRLTILGLNTGLSKMLIGGIAGGIGGVNVDASMRHTLIW